MTPLQCLVGDKSCLNDSWLGREEGLLLWILQFGRSFAS